MKCACDECGRSGGYALYCLRCAELALKKDWVGLTDEEVMIINRKSYDAQIGLLPLTFYRAIESTLREKNK